MPEAIGRKLPSRRWKTWGYLAVLILYASGIWLARMNSAAVHGLGALPVILLGASLILLITGAALLIRRGKYPASFLLVSMSLGLIYLGSITPYAAPDEVYHYQEVISLAHGFLGRSTVDASLISTMGLTPEHNTLAALKTMYGGFGEGLSGVMVPLPHAPVYARSYVYLPQLLSTWAGVLLGANRMTLFFTGGAAMLALHAAMGALALSVMPKGWRLPLYLVMLLPMALQQATSFSYDPLINDMAFLWVAMLARCWVDGRLVHGVWMMALGALMVPIKPPYLFLLMLTFLLPDSGFRSPWGKIPSRWVKAGYTILCIGLGLALMGVILWSQPYHVLNQPVSDGQISLGWVIQQPISAMKKVAAALHPAVLMEMLEAAVGVALASLNLWVGLAPVWCMMTLLMLSTLLAQEKPLLSVPARAGMAGIMVLTYGAFLFVMLMTYTKVDDPAVMGMQGRYLIPLLPVALLAMTTPHIRTEKDYTPMILTAYLLVSLFISDNVWKLTLMA